MSDLETELGEFLREQPRDKVIDVLRKTWNNKKMSPKGRALAQALTPPAEAQDLIRVALG